MLLYVLGVVYHCVSTAEPPTVVQPIAPPTVFVAEGGSGELVQALNKIHSSLSHTHCY